MAVASLGGLGRTGTIVACLLIDAGLSGRDYLVQVFVDVDRIPAEVVTAYRTSRVAKYWRTEP